MQKDLVEAVKWYQKAADQGDIFAQSKLKKLRKKAKTPAWFENLFKTDLNIKENKPEVTKKEPIYGVIKGN